jgi:hypothetical protein
MVVALIACVEPSPPGGAAPAPSDPRRPSCAEAGVACVVAGISGRAGLTADGRPAVETMLYQPQDATPTADGGFWIADFNNHVVREVGADGIARVRVGTGFPSAGEGGPALEEPIKFPSMAAPDPVDAGVMWIAIPGLHELARLEDGWLELPYGVPQAGYAGDGGPVAFAQFAYPSSIAFGDDGALYVSDRMNQVVRRIRDGTIETVVGTPLTEGFAGDGGPADEALLSAPIDDQLDPGNRLDVRGARLVIADTGNDVVREVDLATSQIRTLADGFVEPHDVVIADDGTVYVADTGEACVRAIDPDGGVAIVAGTCGEPGPFESELPATEARFQAPTGVALGPDGALWITDSGSHVVVRVPGT